VPRFLEPLTSLLEGRAPQLPRALKPEVSSGLLQASPPYTRGGLRWYRVFLMPRPIRNYVHRIVLQFYVYFYILLPSCGQSLSLCPVSYPVPRKRERSLHMCAQDVQITRIVTI
jgi:hypothetical protein